MKRSFGFSMAQILMAIAALGGLSVVLVSILRQANQGQQNIEVRANEAALQQRIRASIQSQQAMMHSLSANSSLSACVSCMANPVNCSVAPAPPSCPTSDTPIQLRDAANQSLVPLASASFPMADDGGNPCAVGPGNLATCRWQMTSTFRSVGSDTIHVAVSMKYAGKLSGTPLKAWNFETDVPAALFSSTGDPYVRKSYVDAAQSGGACYTTSNGSCAAGFEAKDSHKLHVCLYHYTPSGIGGMTTSEVPCPSSTQTVAVGGGSVAVTSTELAQSTITTCCRSGTP